MRTVTIGTSLGTHIIMDLYGCDPEILDSIECIKKILIDAARHAKATIVGMKFHKFNPHGVSGVVLVAESHIAIHTWPEHRYASVDIYTCGDHTMPMLACEYIVRVLKSEKPSIIKIDRGLIEENIGKRERKNEGDDNGRVCGVVS